MNVEELKQLLNNYADDVEIVAIAHNFELKNSKISAKVYEIKCTKTIRTFKDAFDGCGYTKDVFVNDQDGSKVLVIYG